MKSNVFGWKSNVFGWKTTVFWRKTFKWGGFRSNGEVFAQSPENGEVVAQTSISRKHVDISSPTNLWRRNFHMFSRDWEPAPMRRIARRATRFARSIHFWKIEGGLKYNIAGLYLGGGEFFLAHIRGFFSTKKAVEIKGLSYSLMNFPHRLCRNN